MFFPLFTIFLSCCLSVAGLTTRHRDYSKELPVGSTAMINQVDPSQVEARQPILQDILEITYVQQNLFPEHEKYIIVESHNTSLGRYLWSGRTGEYYEIPGGWPGWKGEVVAKEFYIWHWPHEFSREVKYLSRVGQFVASDRYKGVQWLIMHKPPGVHLTKTRAFKEAYQKSRKECDDLVERAYEPAFNALIHYIRSYGIYHQVLNSRMLWDDTARNVSIFDLGDDIERDPNDADDHDLRNEVALNVYNAWPNDGIYYQDWCVNGQQQ